MLQTSDALKVVFEAPGVNHETIRMATRDIDPAEETLGDLALFRFVIRSERNTRFDAARNSSE